MADDAKCRVILTLALDSSHWRRHDRAFWAQTLAEAANAAAPNLARVEDYELRDTLMIVRMRSRRPVKAMRKLWEEHEGFMRLRSRLADLGARPEFEVEEC